MVIKLKPPGKEEKIESDIDNFFYYIIKRKKKSLDIEFRYPPFYFQRKLTTLLPSNILTNY